MILKPAWQLLNFHLPVFTEVLGYGSKIDILREKNEEDNGDEGEEEVGYESEDDEEQYGVEGMTMHLIELLTTLISR